MAEAHPPAKARSQIVALFLCVLLLICFVILARSASLEKCATFDEPLDLAGAWAQKSFGDFRCNPEDPPLPKYVATCFNTGNSMQLDRGSPEWESMLDNVGGEWGFSRKSLFQTPANDAIALLNATRARMIGLGVILGIVICWFSWKLAGPVAAVVATALYCLDPNFLAHAPLMKDDVPAALGFLVLMTAIWWVYQRATVARVIFVGMALGAVLVTKFSGVLAVPMLGIALFCRMCDARPWPIVGFKTSAKTLRQRAVGGVAIAMIALFIALGVIWGTYDFRYTMSSVPARPFNTNYIIGLCAHMETFVAHGAPRVVDPRWLDDWRPSLIVRFGIWGMDHHLLPQGWLVGFLYTYAQSLARKSFLCGQYSRLGWWYYFPLVILFKTPLATLAAFGLASVMTIVRLKGKWASGEGFWIFSAMLSAPLFYLGVAMCSNVDLGIRHILVVYPFAFIFVGIAAANVWQRHLKITAGCIGFLGLILVLETFLAFPDYIPFFNAAAGGSRGGLRLLSDSNLDWGQDLPLLQRWQRDHPDKDVRLVYFGMCDPAYFGIRQVEMGNEILIPEPRTAGKSGSVLAISATVLQGTYLREDERKIVEEYRRQKPLAVLGGSIYLYELKEAAGMR